MSDAQIMNLMLENIDRAAWQLRDDVALRIKRIEEIAAETGVQPDAHLSRIISRVRMTLQALEDTQSKIEAMKPVQMEAAE